MLYTPPIVYPKYMDSGIHTIVKVNELFSVMTVCRHGLNNGAMAWMLQINENTSHIIFVL